MKKTIILASLLYSFTAYSQGVNFSHGEYSSAQSLAEKGGKMIFVDFYTDWCAPCKKMTQTIFPQKEVGDFFNENFINLKVNAEKGEGVELAKKYSISEYPTFIFLNSNGEIIYRFMGSREAPALIKEGEKAIQLFKNAPVLVNFGLEFEKGNRDKEFLRQYCILLTESGKETGAPLNDYMAQLSYDELITESNIKLAGCMTLYSKPVMDNIVKILDSLYKLNPKSSEFVQLNRAGLKSLSSFLKNSGKKNTPDEMEELLKVKDQFADFGNRDNIVSASIGGGLAMVPNDELRLSYYKGHKMDKQYADLYGVYIDNYITQNPMAKIVEENIAFEKMLFEGMEKLKEQGKTNKEIEQTKKMSDLVITMRTATYKHYAGLIINDYTQFLKIYNDTQSKQRAADWIWYAYSTCKQEDVAKEAAKALSNLGFEEKAQQVITDFKKIKPE